MIKPIYSKYDYREGHWLWGLGKEDFAKVQKGYACGKCLEDYNGKWLARCPVCGNETELVLDTPSEWKR